MIKSPASRLFNQPFIQAQIKDTIKALRHRPLCGNSPVTGEFPAQMASNAGKSSRWWRHHDLNNTNDWSNWMVFNDDRSQKNEWTHVIDEYIYRNTLFEEI